MVKPKNIMHRALGALREAWLFPVKLYRKYISGLKKSSSCRFYPTCSAYALEAVRRWGIIMGTVLAVWRILRCNPFSRGGNDPVPTPPWEKNIRADRGTDSAENPKE